VIRRKPAVIWLILAIDIAPPSRAQAGAADGRAVIRPLLRVVWCDRFNISSALRSVASISRAMCRTNARAAWPLSKIHRAGTKTNSGAYRLLQGE